MTPRTLIAFLMATIAGLALTGCQRIENVSVEATLVIREAPFRDAVPLEYGNLVAVTSDRNFMAVLWFERPDKSLTAVQINYTTGAMSPTVLEIPRR